MMSTCSQTSPDTLVLARGDPERHEELGSDDLAPETKTLTITVQDSNGRPVSNGSNAQLTRQQLLQLVRQAGIPLSGNKPRSAISEPSSPRKLLSRLRSAPPVEKAYSSSDSSSSSSSSSSTLTSDDEDVVPANSNEFLSPQHSDTNLTKQLEEGKISFVDEVDLTGDHHSFRQRTGSQFYHESFRPTTGIASLKPVTYIPNSHSAQQLNIAFTKKRKGLFYRLRNSFRTHKQQQSHNPVSRTVSDKYSTNTKRWVDYEEELDAVSRPTYFRHIGHIVGTGPGLIKTVELNRPSHGKFGVYIAQGSDVKCPNSTSIFVSRFYQENMTMFYASLLRPGDEILAINGEMIRDTPILKVTEMFEKCQTVRLMILPSTEQ